jgi:hypothetical protein
MALTKQQLEYQRQWRKNNPAEYRKQQIRTKQNRSRKMAEDIDFFIDQYYKSLRVNAERRNISFNLSKRQLSKVIKNSTHCVISGRQLTRTTNCPNRVSIDRIDNRFGYSINNIQAVCVTVNIHRLDLSLDDFFQLALDIVKHQKKINAKRKSR